MKYVTADTAKFIQDVTPFDYTYRNVTAAVSIPTSPLPPKSKPMKTVATGFQSIPETMITKFLDASVRLLHLNIGLRQVFC